MELFHKAAVPGPAGEMLREDLTKALSDTDVLVAVVLNTIDDTLDRGREGIDTGWRVADVGALRTLLDHARYHGRAVILTSDHGHVVDRGSELRPAPDAESARHRTGQTPAGEGEVERTGARVVAPGGRVVALWDADGRYAARRAGYHGGASLSEVTIPLLAFLPFGAAAPPDWHALPDQTPAWWSLDTAPRPVAAETPVPPTSERPRRRPKPAGVTEGQTAFDIGPAQKRAAEAAPAAGTAALVDALLGSEMFQAQHGTTPRKVPLTKVTAAVTALLDANGVLPAVVVAERAGEQVSRAAGFATTLQRIFNVDNYPVLSLADEGRTVRLDVRLLREQFA